MTVLRMDHVGIVVEDLAAAVDFFVEVGLVLEGGATVEGAWVDRVIGLDNVQAEIAMMRTPDGHGGLELSRFRSPPSRAEGDGRLPANVRGLRHLSFEVDDLEDTLDRLRARGTELIGGPERYEDSYLLCYVRGPEGIIVELAEQLG